MTKIISIGVLLFLMYRLIVNGGKFLNNNSSNSVNHDSSNRTNKGDYVDYEEVESRTKD